jgi:hypothetical protein
MVAGKALASLCEVAAGSMAWQWAQPNGQLRDMVARRLMLSLHRAGLIQLPEQRFRPPNNAAQHRGPASELPLKVNPLECSLGELGPLGSSEGQRSGA